jgi:biopolymer transport protein ExbD/biopolymer transport protein TolR
MHLSAGKNRKKFVDEINITPLTDVFLVLLIIMMVVAPMLKTIRTDIHPPDVKGADPLTKVKLLVEITKEGLYFVDSDPVTTIRLAETLQAKSNQPDVEKSLVIRADALAKTRSVMNVMTAASKAGFKQTTIAIEALPESRGQELTEGLEKVKMTGESAAP